MSVSRHCRIYKASNSKWYLELADQEYAGQEDATTYGPFADEQAALKHLDMFSNPGGMWVDDSGNEPPPSLSPNGLPVRR